MIERPIASPRDPYEPGSIGEMRVSTPVVYEHRVSAPYIVAGVAALIGIGALGAYWYNTEVAAPEQVATATMPAAPSTAQPEVPPQTAPTAQDEPQTMPQEPLTKEKEQNSMPLANHGNNHSSESLEPKKAKVASVPRARSTSTSSRPATTPKPEPVMTPSEPPAPLTVEPPAPASPPKQADTPTPPPVQEPPKPVGTT
jgi:hypothetical protein